MAYTLTQQEFRTLKTALTRAINSGDRNKILATTAKAMEIFDEKGWPDDWARWQRAHDDALLAEAHGWK